MGVSLVLYVLLPAVFAHLWDSVHDCLESRVEVRLRGSSWLTSQPSPALLPLSQVLSSLRKLLG